MRPPEAGPPEARIISTPQLQMARHVVTDIASHQAVGVIHGDTGLGKTFGVRTCATAMAASASRMLAPEVVTVSFTPKPTMRQVVDGLHLALTGNWGSKSRFHITKDLITELARTPRLIVVDEAQRLTSTLYDARAWVNQVRYDGTGELGQQATRKLALPLRLKLAARLNDAPPGEGLVRLRATQAGLLREGILLNHRPRPGDELCHQLTPAAAATINRAISTESAAAATIYLLFPYYQNAEDWHPHRLTLGDIGPHATTSPSRGSTSPYQPTHGPRSWHSTPTASSKAPESPPRPTSKTPRKPTCATWPTKRCKAPPPPLTCASWKTSARVPTGTAPTSCGCGNVT